MSKIGRNEPCPCGSGKKYKKCCLNKSEKDLLREDPIQYLDSFWTYKEANKMSTNEIIQKLQDVGIIFNEERFLNNTEKSYSAYQISEFWFKSFKVTARDRDEDFPYIAAVVLWERLAPDHILSMEQMSDLIDIGYKYLSEKVYETACDSWLKVWEAIKFRYKTEFKNLDFLNEQYKKLFFIRNICQDLEMELHNAGLRDNNYFGKRIEYCREFIDLFPLENKNIIHNMRRSIAESYVSLDNNEQAELEYEKLVQDYPDNPWGYIGWGDMHFWGKVKDYIKANEFYNMGLEIAKDKTDIVVLEERLEDLKYKMKTGDQK